MAWFCPRIGDGVMAVRDVVQAAAGNSDGGVVAPVGVDFDGTNDYLSRSSDLTGNADGKTFTLSFWMYQDRSRELWAYCSGRNNVGSYNFIAFSKTSGAIEVAGYATGGSTSRVFDLDLPALPQNTFLHILISVDLTNSANRYVYVNDENYTSLCTFGTYTNANISFSEGFTHTIGNRWIFNTSDQFAKGRLAGVYLDYTYRDLSVEANRRLFIDADGLYVTPPTSGIISVPMDDASDPGRNDGTGGDFTLNGIVAQSGRGPNQYNAAASTFDGSADYLSRSVSVSDSNKVTGCFIFKPNSPSFVHHIFSTNGEKVRIRWVTGDYLEINARNAAGTVLIDAELQNLNSYSKYRHVSFSFDLSDTGKRHVQIDGVDASPVYNTYASGNMDFTDGNFGVGGRPTGVELYNGELSEFWLFPGVYIDLSSDNPFYDTETDKPKYLGASGELPTGSAPLIYLPMYANDAGNNLGTGGDFTVNSGPYVGARGPSEYWAESAAFNGSNQYLSRTSALTGASDGKAITLAVAVALDSSANGTAFSISDSSGNPRLRLNLVQSFGGDTRIVLDAVEPSGGSLILGFAERVTQWSAGDWHTLLISVDLSDASKRHFYDNLADISPSWTYVNDNMILSSPRATVGAQWNGSSYDNWIDGKIGFLWFGTEYIDFSQEANRLKFFDAFNNPVDLGEDGSTPTGSQPLIYLNKGFHLGTNLGSGGNFTPQNTPTDGGYING